MNPEKLKFITEHADEIKPTAADESATKDIENVVEGRSVDENKVDAILEGYETKVLTYERSNASPDASRILIEASQPANYGAGAPIIKDLIEDPRCVGITLLTDNAAGKDFQESGLPLQQVRYSQKEHEESVLADIPGGPYDVALAFDEPQNTPQSVLLYGAKSVFGANKLYFFAGGLVGKATQRILSPDADPTMDTIDAIFVEDELSKRFLCEIAHVPEANILVTGSPLVEALEPEKAESLRAIGRKKLRISDTALVAFFSSIVSTDEDFKKIGGAEDLNTRTYEETVAGVRIAAEHDPAREYVLIIRTHPRMLNVEPPLPIPTNLPSNMRIVRGEREEVSFDEVVYASDVLCCNPLASDVLLAAYRGRVAAITAYAGENQSGQLCERIYGEEGIRIIRDSGRAVFAESPQGLAAILEHQRELPQPLPKPAGSARQIIKELLLNKKSNL